MLAHLAEQRWLEARDRGALEHLVHTGRPLVWDDDSFVPPEWRTVFHLLSNAGLAPAWICLDREIRDGLEGKLRELCAARTADPRDGAMWHAACMRFRAPVREIHQRIACLDVIVPHGMFQLSPVDAAGWIAGLRAGSAA